MHLRVLYSGYIFYLSRILQLQYLLSYLLTCHSCKVCVTKMDHNFISVHQFPRHESMFPERYLDNITGC